MIQVTIGEAGASSALSAPIIAACISALVAIITGSVVAYIAWRQWRTAQDKLALDLFDRRHAVWREGSEAYTEALRDLIENDGVLNEILWVTPGLAAFGRAKEKAFFLFGPDVMKAWQKVEMALFHLGKAKGRSRGMFEPDDAFEKRLRDEDRHSTDANVGWEELKAAITPYMMLGHMAVNRPARSFKPPRRHRD